MKILHLTWKSFGNEDIQEAFKEAGHVVISQAFSDKSPQEEETSQKELLQAIKKHSPDCVFSFNYFPIASNLCHQEGIPYLAWIYDSPYVRLYHHSVIHPTNHIFCFDKETYMEFHNGNIPTFHYLPLAANTSRLEKMTDFSQLKKSKWNPQHEISFIGSMYTEKHQFFQRMQGISDYTEGYLRGLMESQKLVYGYNFIQSSLPKDIIADMQNHLPLKPSPNGIESIEYLFAQYVINRQITAEERLTYLSDISKQFGLDLYTPDNAFQMPGSTNHGSIDYYDMAPYVFKCSKINLNITLRSILSGIPLRAFDILGAGGFLMTNYQADFADCYTADEDFVYYENIEDMKNKISYYLSHEDERAAIAKNGFEKTKAFHTYRHRVDEMLSYL